MSQSNESSELASDTGETSDDAVMSLLAAKRQEHEEPAAEQEEEEEERLAPAEEGEEEEAPEEVEDDDPEIDLGEIKLKKSELKAGYMKDADYRRKTAEAAEVKRQAQAITERVAAERSHYANHLDVFLEGLQRELIGDQQHLAKLAVKDPAEWVAQNAAFQQRAQRFQQAVSERQALSARTSEDEQRQLNDWRNSEREQLQAKLPEWRDQKRAAEEQKVIAEYAIEKGYTQDELKELFDHRALLVLRDAALYHKQRAAKDKQVAKTPPNPNKPGVPRAANTNQTQRYQDAMKRASKTGRDEDVLAVLAAKRIQK